MTHYHRRVIFKTWEDEDVYTPDYELQLHAAMTKLNETKKTMLRYDETRMRPEWHQKLANIKEIEAVYKKIYTQQEYNKQIQVYDGYVVLTRPSLDGTTVQKTVYFEDESLIHDYDYRYKYSHGHQY